MILDIAGRCVKSPTLTIRTLLTRPASQARTMLSTSTASLPSAQPNRRYRQLRVFLPVLTVSAPQQQLRPAETEQRAPSIITAFLTVRTARRQHPSLPTAFRPRPWTENSWILPTFLVTPPR